MANDDKRADGENGDGRSLRNRKDRLANLKVRHQVLAEEPDPEPAPARQQAPAAALRGGRGGGPGRLLGQGAPGGAGGRGAGGLLAAIGPQQRQMIGRIYGMLTQDQNDGSGLVPGTPFTRSGVERLMNLLRQRAQDQGAPGSKIAQSALNFIESGEGESDSIAGASLEKLQLIAKRVDGLKSRGGAGRMGGF